MWGDDEKAPGCARSAGTRDVEQRDPASMGRQALCLWSLFCILLCSVVAAKALTAAAHEPRNRARPHLKNHYTAKPEAIAEGQMLFGEAGCSKCHGTAATGGEGPNLTDDG